MKIKIETDGRTDNAKTICPVDLSQAGHKKHQSCLSVFETAVTDSRQGHKCDLFSNILAKNT